MTWKVLDVVSGREFEFDEEPGREELVQVKNELGYTAIKIVNVDRENQRIEIAPFDLAG